MANKRYDVKTPQAGRDGKTYWTKIGTMWADDKGGFSIDFTALPVPAWDERSSSVRTRALCFEPKPFDGQRSQPAAPTGGGGYPDADYGKKAEDDDIPFATCAEVAIGTRSIDRI